MIRFRENMNDAKMQKMLDELKDNIDKQKNIVSDNMELFFQNKQKYIIFISVSDGKSRACVTKGIGNTLEATWKNAIDSMREKVKKSKLEYKWIKADIIRSIKRYEYLDFIKYISEIKINYFREGIAFDDKFKIAFLGQEVNANAFIHEIKDSSIKGKRLDWKNINYYLKSNASIKSLIDESKIANVYTFDTIGYVHDGENCYELCNDGLDAGRRYIKTLDDKQLRFIIEKSSNFLSDQVAETGRFCYGYFPCFDKKIPAYNILRHASTTYSMIEAYEFNRDAKLEERIKLALEYLLKEGIKPFIDNNGSELAFVIERLKDDSSEIKLGANAAALLAFAKYTKVFHNENYLRVMQALAEGIRFFQNTEVGSFVHVLNFPDLTVKDKHRIIYYDGEAAFALMRLYDIDRNVRWLNTVEKAFEYYIKKKYWKNNDHWLSYCSYELMKYKPDKRYVMFNLENASGILDFCLARETTYPTLLELLMATYCMIEKLKKENIFLETLESFDYEKLINAIEHRARHQLNGLYFPEVAMYFKAPEKILWSFYIRHHSFRARIDDNEHNISGYCSYLHNRLNENGSC